uniref:Sulfotransferase family protein n=1 Tax=uncultured bacterium esnapd17 TaxID=1366598 RepID=S5UD30_9BACT|nr:hypothetical protein [uncultured bacterium esnapd17]
MFLRMMAERGDFAVVHEPLSHVKDFGSAEVLDRHCADADAVLAAILELGAQQPLFVKDTTDFHYPEVLATEAFLTGVRHTFIIRHPRDAIASHFGLNPDLQRDEIGFAWLREIYDAVAAATGETPVVLDADEVVADPATAVERYCAAVGIPFLPEALEWEPGTIEQWNRTKRWHTDVADSAGIQPGRSSRPKIDVDGHPVLGGYYRFHLPHYEWLHARRLKV